MLTHHYLTTSSRDECGTTKLERRYELETWLHSYVTLLDF